MILHERHGALDHQQRDCFLNRLFRRASKETPKPRITDPLWGDFPHKRLVMKKVSMSWRHNDNWTKKIQEMFSRSRDHLCMRPANERRRYDVTSLHRNVVSHWLGAYTKWSLLSRTMHESIRTFCALWWLGTKQNYPYTSGLLHWQWDDHVIFAVSLKHHEE